MQFLSGLDDSFNQVKSHILLMDHLPNVKVAFSIVSREDSHQKNGSLISSSSVSTTHLLLLIVGLMIEEIQTQI